MNKTPSNNVVDFPSPLLPADAGKALRTLVTYTEKLIGLTDRETQALVQNDITAFAILQDEKEKISLHYARASAEFRERLEEFRGIGDALIRQLEKLQIELGDKSRSNGRVIEQIYSRAKNNTDRSLITAQELGQKARLHLEDIEKQSDMAQSLHNHKHDLDAKHKEGTGTGS